MNEKRDLKKLFKTCFPDETDEYIDYFFEKIYRRKNTFYKKVNGKIVSAFHLVEKNMRIAGNDFFVPFITAAGTLPEDRAMGHMGELLSAAFPSLKDKKIDFIALGTDDKHGLYKKYGFITYSFYHEEEILQSEKKNYKLVEIESVSTEAAKVLETVYEKFTEGKNGFIKRDREYFMNWQEELFADNGKLYFIKEGRNYTGYIYDNFGELEECVLLDGGLQNCLKEFSGKKFKVFSESGTPHNMIRLLNPVSVLGKIEFAGDVTDTVTIKLRDDKIKDNNALLKLDIENGHCKVSAGEKADFNLTVAELTALIMGVSSGLPDRLTRLFNRQQNVVLDRY